MVQQLLNCWCKCSFHLPCSPFLMEVLQEHLSTTEAQQGVLALLLTLEFCNEFCTALSLLPFIFKMQQHCLLAVVLSSKTMATLCTLEKWILKCDWRNLIRLGWNIGKSTDGRRPRKTKIQLPHGRSQWKFMRFSTWCKVARIYRINISIVAVQSVCRLDMKWLKVNVTALVKKTPAGSKMLSHISGTHQDAKGVTELNWNARQRCG